MPDLFTHQPHLQSRWASFENPAAAPSAGATTNQGRKGAAFSRIAAGETKTLLDIRGAGTIRRIWATISPRTPKILRSVVLEIFWDDAATPAVSAPLGDFFCQPLGRLYSFENELFSNPEGKSLNCCIPMPFRKAARIILRNESDTPLSHIFYDVDLTLGDVHDDHALYFHAAFSRQTPPVGQDFTILPQLHGRGRFLGASLGVLSNPLYGDTWWGEGEVKVYLDGDTANPTLVGTGTEDYIGTAWGQGVYAHRYQGCLAADGKTRRYAFYRLHVPDPHFLPPRLPRHHSADRRRPAHQGSRPARRRRHSHPHLHGHPHRLPPPHRRPPRPPRHDHRPLGQLPPPGRLLRLRLLLPRHARRRRSCHT